MGDDLIRYDILTQDALRRVIRKVLEEVQRSGLPGDHHFFITYDTAFPGVRLSNRMKEKYPDEMTIVIQHSFWNLEVEENCFEIDLSFDDVRERLRIPFDAISGFFDPAVKFGLQFDSADAAEGGNKKAKKTTRKKSETGSGSKSTPAEAAGADIVSLDSFRNKK